MPQPIAFELLEQRDALRRRAAWARLAADLPMDKLDAMTSETGLAELLDLSGQILKGQIRGRTVVEVNG